MELNKVDKEIEEYFLDLEDSTLNKLKSVYNQAVKDCQNKAKELQDEIDKLIAETDPNDEIAQSQIRSKVYQQKYQQNLEKQINALIDKINDPQVKTIRRFIYNCYHDGFISEQYRLMNDGINIIMPINQKLMREAINTSPSDIPLSKRIYDNTEKVKTNIIGEISRGLATGRSTQEIARNLDNVIGVGMRKSFQIAQNEGARVRQKAIQNSMSEAKDKGADIVKQWSATLDHKTRPIHAELDGQYAEIEEPFKYSGGEVNAPKEFGIPSEDINCRCTLLSVPRWDMEETETRYDNEQKKLVDNVKNYKDWYRNYYLKNLGKQVLTIPNNPQSDYLKRIYMDCTLNGVYYLEVEPLLTDLSEKEIIEKLAGGDLTQGSCQSLAQAYVGNKAGYDVLDYRGGASRDIFSSGYTSYNMAKLNGVNGDVIYDTNDFNALNVLFGKMKEKKEYLLSTGKHTAIIKKDENGDVLYLEMQSSKENGWKKWKENDVKTRFGLQKKHTSYGNIRKVSNVLIDIETLYNNDEFLSSLGFLNTEEEKQKKGALGVVK